jgi:hypothetical protein
MGIKPQHRPSTPRQAGHRTYVGVRERCLSVAVVSFYMDNIPRPLVAAQDAVVRRFLPESWSFLQIHAARRRSKAIDDLCEAVDQFLRSTEYETVLLLDIDCIPLNAGALEVLAADARPDQLVGCAQRANHIRDGKHLYAGPFCCGIDMRLYRAVGRPSFAATACGDVGEQLTYACEAAGKSIKLLWPVAVEKRRWKLTDNLYFGIGTNYQTLFWHLFESRFARNRSRFLRKCRSVLDSSSRP